MRNRKQLVAAGMLVVALSAMMCSPGLTSKASAQAFGMIAATVEKGDDTRGLTIRAEPSESARAVGYLSVGTEIRACNDFKANWARIQSPSPGGWVNMVNLKPKGGEGSVVAVDASDQCLAIRKGPGNSFERVGCARMGQILKLSGIWSENNYARLESGDWVDATKVSTDLMTCDASSPPPVAEAPPPDQYGTAQAPPPVDYQESAPTYVPSYDGGYTYAPSYNYGTFGVPYLFGPYCGFGFYPGWWSGASVVIGNAYPWRHWRSQYYHHRPHPMPYVRNHPHPMPYGHNRPYAHPYRSNAAVNRGVVNANRSMVNTNRTNVNNFRARNAANVANFRSNNAAFNRGFSNYAVRNGSVNGAFRSNRANVTSFRGNSFRAGNVASTGFRGNSFRAGNFASSAFRSNTARAGNFASGGFRGAGVHAGGRRR